MRSLLLCLLILVIDVYVFQGFRFVFRNSSENVQRWMTILYWTVSCFSLGIIIAAQLSDWHTWNKAFRTYSFAVVFITILSKVVLLLFVLTDDLFRGGRWVWNKASSPADIATGEGITRSDFLIKTGMAVAALPFVSLIWGMAKGAYDYQVKRIKIVLPNLPDAFNGFRIVQVSDIHTGSFVSTVPLQTAVKLINDQKADLILFTGDLVNNSHDEALPHMQALSKLAAPHGVYSILGNHDYGDYILWSSPQAKVDNLKRLIGIHKEMGWNILLDEHRTIEKDGEKLTLIGVQNWSTHLRFPKYGSMEKATKDIAYSNVNILLSHDPSHWDGEILTKYPKVDLMLAGHTHGMQFGIEIPGFKWSPVQYIYKQWAGLYQQGHQMLYVNRGLGFLGYPGRVGILPEITVLELTRG